MKVEKQSSNMILAFLTLLGVIGLVALIGFFMLDKENVIIQGQAEVTEYRVSGKVPGRIQAYLVEEGKYVRKGDTLVILDTPEINAKLQQAKAAQEAAEAQNKKAIKGVRTEQIDAAYELWQKAIAGRTIMEKSFSRINNLYAKGVVSAQKRDEAEAQYKAAVATEKAAESQYKMAKNGAEKEDKMAAEAMVERAKGAVEEVEAYLKEGYLLAPTDGEITEIFPQPGELVGTGAPIMNIADMTKMWVTFNVREDLLNSLKIGNTLTAYVPALNNKTIELKITSMKDLGSYAAWKATKTTGTFDARTFEVKAKPTQVIEGLRPGMSVLLDQSK